ncbi:uncharacterized protein LOC134534122 isoform X2 [Bacillus rossius redtenbacheri]|uniref:uncharacterized protein LOC134534122 isoform X2 n=1 Tax=Bacillus rossius redtenbacheri TaxID=93214 RepID=UPI002FDD9795
MSTTPLNLMACVRESSPQDMTTELSRNESKRRRFHPLRGLRRMFRRKARHSGCELPEAADPLRPEDEADPHRSRSASELLAADEAVCRRRSGSGLYPGHAGLSVSHDSVFTAEQRSCSSREELRAAGSSSSLSVQQLVLPGVKAELVAAVRRRGRSRADTSEEDEDQGLPRSPCGSPNTADVLLEKENPTKSHSTCSDGSLLSMGSSEMDEDSFGQTSGHSSKLSLHDKKTAYYDNDAELDVGVSGVPLSHSAARHKMSVRPKRTHGAPRRRRAQQLSAASPLPATPEVNEEASGRSVSPEPKEALKGKESPVKLARSRSSATNQRFGRPTSDSEQEEPQEICSTVGEEEEDEIYKEKEDKITFFGRLLSRRSGKKKKEKIEDSEQTSVKLPVGEVIPKRIDNKGRYANEDAVEYFHAEQQVVKPYGAKVGGGLRTKVRQRVEPINIPASPEVSRRQAYNDIAVDVEPAVLDFSLQPQSSEDFKQIPRLPGLGPFHNNIMNLGVRDFSYEERECISLIQPSSERKQSNLSVKKSHSFRGDLDYALPKSQPHNVPLKVDAYVEIEDDECGLDSLSEDAVDAQLDEVTVSYSSPSEIIYLDSLEDTNASSESTPFKEVNLIEEILDEQKIIHTSQEDKTSFDQGRLYTKNNVVVTRSIVKDTSYTGKTNTSSFSVTNTKHLMKKSSSLESISSFGEGKGLTSPELSSASKKSSSTESIGSYTHTLEISKEKSISYTCNEMSTVTHTTTISTDFTPTPHHEKQLKHSFRSATPKYVPNTPHVPEFLRVQLNRVDVKPSNIVLSTNVIFDSEKFNSPKATTERVPSFSKSNENLTKIIKISETSCESMKKECSADSQPSLLELRVRPDCSTMVPLVHISHTTNDLLYASNLSEQGDDVASVETSKHVVAGSQNNRDIKTSIMSLSSELVSTTPRVSVVDLDSAEIRKEIMKKQMSSNYEDIKIIEKSCAQVEDEIGISEVVFNKSKGKRRDDRSVSGNVYQNSGDENEILPTHKTANKDAGIRKGEGSKCLPATVPIGLQSSTIMPEVVLRKKSLPRESGQQKDEEPELLKVFARRSLKLKDSDTENLLQPVGTKSWENHAPNDQTSLKSRDSDKENEGGESPREDRKKQHTKEPLAESKLHVETSEIVLRSSTSVSNSRLSNIPNKYQQRSHSTGLENGGTNENVPVTFRKDGGGSPEKRQRNRTVPESPGSGVDRTPHRAWAATRRDKDFDAVIGEEKVVLKPRGSATKGVESEMPNTDKGAAAVPSAPKDDGSIPRFKRIQQRREEWEKRAQQAAKRTVP